MNFEAARKDFGGNGLKEGEAQASFAVPANLTGERDLSCADTQCSRVALAQSFGGDGQKAVVNQTGTAIPTTLTDDRDHPYFDTHGARVAVVQPFGGDGHMPDARDRQSEPAVSAETIAGLRMIYRQRQDLLNAEKSLTLQIKAICRRFVGGDKAKAADVYRALMKDAAADVGIAAACLLASRGTITAELKKVEKECVREAKVLHVAPFVESTPGFGYMGLAQIVGEAGDLSNYANPGKLWKRFGLAPFKGKAPSQWRVRGGLSKDEFEQMGYAPRRRSVCYVIGDSLIKKAGPYRTCYLDAKARVILREQAKGKTVLPAAKIPKNGGDAYVSEMHMHRWAQMYMEKRLLRELWRAWRGGSE